MTRKFGIKKVDKTQIATVKNKADVSNVSGPRGQSEKGQTLCQLCRSDEGLTLKMSASYGGNLTPSTCLIAHFRHSQFVKLVLPN